jgi:DNA (cytosine-5)-methyltransferase 1
MAVAGAKVTATRLARNPYRLRKAELLRRPALPTAVDLFSGAGGITLGLVNAGFNVVYCADLDEGCEATHKRNFPSIPFQRKAVQDIKGAEILKATGLQHGELDLLIGGPPCQGFSILGQREIWDPRNGLFREFIRVARELKPKCVVIENVTGLATLGAGRVLADIRDAFRGAGYNVDCAELLAAQYGVPQMRWRMFFVGWRLDQGKKGGFPLPTHGRAGIGDLVPNRKITSEESGGFVTIREAIADLGVIEAGEVGTKYRRRSLGSYQEAMREGVTSLVANHYAPRLSPQNIDRLRALKPGQDWRDLPRRLLPAGMQRALRKDHTRRYRRMQWLGVARTIITRFRDPKSGEYTHPEQHRTISIREAARIQSFPDWFVFEGSYSQQYDQVGNAVPPLLAKAVGMELRDMLSGIKTAPVGRVKSRYVIPEDRQLALA